MAFLDVVARSRASWDTRLMNSERVTRCERGPLVLRCTLQVAKDHSAYRQVTVLVSR